MKLLKAFNHMLTEYFPPLKSKGLFQNICLFSQLLMLREYEILFWVALNTKKDIDQEIKEHRQDKNAETMTMSTIRSRLMMTAFYTKQKLSQDSTEQAINAFFWYYFDYFIGKYTDWLLLNEPDINSISPASLNVIG